MDTLTKKEIYRLRNNNKKKWKRERQLERKYKDVCYELIIDEEYEMKKLELQGKEIKTTVAVKMFNNFEDEAPLCDYFDNPCICCFHNMRYYFEKVYKHAVYYDNVNDVFSTNEYANVYVPSRDGVLFIVRPT